MVLCHWLDTVNVLGAVFLVCSALHGVSHALYVAIRSLILGRVQSLPVVLAASFAGDYQSAFAVA